MYSYWPSDQNSSAHKSKDPSCSLLLSVEPLPDTSQILLWSDWTGCLSVGNSVEGEGSGGNLGHMSQVGMGATLRSWAMRPCSSVMRVLGSWVLMLASPPTWFITFTSHFNSLRVSFSQLSNVNKNHSSLVVKLLQGLQNRN